MRKIKEPWKGEKGMQLELIARHNFSVAVAKQVLSPCFAPS